MLVRSLGFELFLVITNDPSDPRSFSACASTARPLLSTFWIHSGILPRRASKKSLIAGQALLGNVVAGSSHLVSMLRIAGNDSSSTNHSRIFSFQATILGVSVTLAHIKGVQNTLAVGLSRGVWRRVVRAR